MENLIFKGTGKQLCLINISYSTQFLHCKSLVFMLYIYLNETIPAEIIFTIVNNTKKVK